MQMKAQNNWENNRVFVTGGTGFIGSHLTAKLLSLGAELGQFVHAREGHPATRQIQGDLYSPYDIFETDKLKRFLDEFQPEVVYHLAAQPLVSVAQEKELETLRTNIDGTYNLLHVCRTMKSIRSFVHISTDKVYGNTSVITKDTKPSGVHHPYNASKYAGDVLAQMYSNFFDIPMVIVRNANVYGAGDTHLDRVIPRTIVNVVRGEKPVIRGDGSNTRDYIHVSDVIDAYVKVARLPYENSLTTVNLGGFNHSVISVVDTILEKMGRVDLAPVFERQWRGEIPHQHIVNDSSVAGWKPSVSLDKGLDLTISWYRTTYGV